MRIQIITLILIQIFVGSIYAQNISPVAQVQELYENGLFEEAELLCLRLINSPTETLENPELAEVHRLLAFILIARGDSESGYRQFKEALYLNPLLRVDPLLTPPKISTVFQRSLTDFEIEKEKEVLRKIEIAAPFQKRIIAGRKNLLFPGLGQLYKGEKIKGWGFIGFAAAGAGGWVISEIQVFRTGRIYEDAKSPDDAVSAYEDYSNWWKLRSIFGYSFAGAWLISTLDAFLAEQVVENKLSINQAFSANGDPMLAISIRF